jgi:nicotinamide-nucleotide amidase
VKAAVLAVGNEVLYGDTQNSNGAYLASELTAATVQIVFQTVLADEIAQVAAAITHALRVADLVVLIGGLGPTVDDITRQAVAEATSCPLALDQAAMAQIEQYFLERKRPMPESNRRQALLPAGGEALGNDRGTAPGLWLELGSQVVVALPGPPIELEPMFQASVLPRLRQRLKSGRAVTWLRTSGIGESSLQELLGDLLTSANPSVLPYAKLGEVHLRILADAASQQEAEQMAAGRLRAVRERIGPYVYGQGNATLEGVLLETLLSRHETLAVSESATGGLVSARLSDPAGASQVFLGGSVVYTALAKVEFGALERSAIDRNGAVSAWTAKALAESVRQKLGATWGLATCGWAGPQADGEVGLAYTAVAGTAGVESQEHRLGHNRYDVRHRLTQAALWHLYQVLGREG